MIIIGCDFHTRYQQIAMMNDATGEPTSTVGSTGYPAWGFSWTYDRYGNRTAQTVTAGSGPSDSLTVSASSNQITGSPFAYDAGGSMTNDGYNTLVYDAANHAISASNGSSSGAYAYDGSGLRVKKSVPMSSPTTTTVYIYSGSKVIAEYVNGASVGSPTHEYLYVGNILLATVSSSTITYHHGDHLSPRLTTDSSGNIAGEQGHFPFGESWYASSTTTKYQFTNYERDAESGNDYALARHYINRLGRFSSVDPLAGNIGDPQSLNRYAYTEDNPINFNDPSGKFLSALGYYDPCDDVTLNRRNSQSSDGFYDGPNDGAVGILDGIAMRDDGCGISGDGDDPIDFQCDDYSTLYYDGGCGGSGGGPGGDGGGGGGSASDNTKPWDLRSTLVAILRATNDCSKWFNQGTGSAPDVMSNVPITLFTPTNPSPIPHENADAKTTSSPQSPIQVSTIGRFYSDSDNQNLVGPFKPGSTGAQMVILFHELGHKINPPGFTDDSVFNPAASDKNTQSVVDNCFAAIMAAIYGNKP